MENSTIEWTRHTFNPWIGCAKVSPGCKFCYAETLMATRYGRVEWGPGKARSRTSPATWRNPLAWDRKAAAAGERQRVFCASLADVLDAEVDPAWLEDLLRLVVKTPNLDWLLLTKREQRLHIIPELLAKLTGKDTAPNVWLGVSAENQEMWDKRVPLLIQTPAVVHFVSAEPLLGPIVMGKNQPDWLIVGGESGHTPRPMEEAWVRALRDECNTAFHFKQWGGKRKKEAGRILDGRTWDEFPTPRNLQRKNAA